MNAMINIIKENNKFEAKPQMYNSRFVDPRKKVLSRFSMFDGVGLELMSAYDAEDTQNYNGTAYKVLLALSDWETHAAPLRDSGNGQLYMNRVLKGMLTTTAVAKYIAESRGLMMR